MSENTITVELVQQHDYRFDIHFADAIPVLTSDEPAPWARATAHRPCSYCAPPWATA